MFSQLGIPLTIAKRVIMMEMKGPKLRSSPMVLRIPSSPVLDVVAAGRVVFSSGSLHESVLYRRDGAVGTP